MFNSIFPNIKNINKYNNTDLNELINRKEIILGGKFGTKFYGSLSIYLQNCINDTKNNKNYCKPQKEIDLIIKKTFLQIQYINSYVNYLNKKLNEYFSSIDFFSDNNILFNQETHFTSTKIESILSDINYIQENDEIFYSINLLPSETKK